MSVISNSIKHLLSLITDIIHRQRCMRAVFIVIMLCASVMANGQRLTDYTYSLGVDSSKWIPLDANATLLIPENSGVHVMSAVVPIGMDFPFASTVYDQFSVSSNGDFFFGDEVYNCDYISRIFLSDELTYHPTKINMLGITGYINEDCYVRYATVGVSPNRTTVVEYAIAKHPSTYANVSPLKWQVQLQEDGNILIVFQGTSQNNYPPSGRQVGLSSSNNDICLINVNHALTHYNTSTNVSNQTSFWPESNRFYLFTRPNEARALPKWGQIKVTDTTVTVDWIERGCGDHWSVTLRDASGTAVDSQIVYTNHAVYTGLSEGTYYTLELFSNLNDTISYTTYRQLRTDCASIPASELPWIYGGELMTDINGNNITPCFTIGDGVSTTSYSSSPEGLNVIVMQRNTYITPYFTLPPFTESWDSLVLKFSYKEFETTENPIIRLGAVMDVNRSTRGDSLTTIYVTDTWQQVEIPLALYSRISSPDTTWHISLMVDDNNDAQVIIDDIRIERLSSCAKPYELKVTPGATDVFVEWIDVAAPHSYVVELRQEGTLIKRDTVGDSMYCTINHLLPRTTYTVTVRTLCDSVSNDSAMVEFTTFCKEISSSELDWHNGFEPNEIPGGCDKLYDLTNPTIAPTVSSTRGFYSSHSLLFSAEKNNCYALPLFDTNINELEVCFRLYSELDIDSSRSGHMDGISVLIADYPDMYSPHTRVKHIEASHTKQWEYVTMNLTNYSGNGRYIVFCTDIANDKKIFIDDIVIKPSRHCDQPATLIVDTIGNRSVTLHWSDSVGSVYQLSWFREGLSRGPRHSVFLYDTTYTIANLQAGSIYTIELTRQCNNGVLSSGREVTIETSLGPIGAAELPWTEDFEFKHNGDVVSYSTPQGWIYNSSGSVSMPNLNANTPIPPISGKKSLYITNNMLTYAYAIMPPIDTTSINIHNLQVSLAARRLPHSNNGQLSKIDVGVMSDPNTQSSFVPVQTIDMSALPVNTTQVYKINLASYSGNGNYIAFRCDNDSNNSYNTFNYIMIDNVMIDYATSCAPPLYVRMPVLKSTSATITWPSSVGISYWMVYVGGPECNVRSEEILEITDDIEVYDTRPRRYICHDTTLNITGLRPEQQYKIIVKPVCSSNDEEGSAPLLFTTPGDPLTYDELPYSVSPIVSNNRHCWYSGSDLNKTTNFNNTTNNCFVLGGLNYNSEKASNYLAMPEFESDIDRLQISFKYNLYYAYSCMYLGVMSNPYDITTFDTLAAYNTISYNYIEESFSFINYHGNGKYIAFLTAQRDTAGGNIIFPNTTSFNLKDIVINNLSTCHFPSPIATDSIGQTSAHPRWNSAPSSVAGYIIAYSTHSGFNADTVSSLLVSNDTSITINGLQPSTTYYWRVSTNCASGSSEWSPEQMFRTLPSCNLGTDLRSDTIGSDDNASSIYTFYNFTGANQGFSANIIPYEELSRLGIEGHDFINTLSLYAIADDYLPRLRVYMYEAPIGSFPENVDGSQVTLPLPNNSTTTLPSTNGTSMTMPMTCVYDSSLTIQNGTITNIYLDSAFEYSVLGDIVILFVRDGQPSHGAQFLYSNTNPLNLSLCGYTSTSHGDDSTLIAFSTNKRTNIIVGSCYAEPQCQRPINFSLLNLEDTLATIRWDGNSSQYEYLLLTDSLMFSRYATGLITDSNTTTFYNLQPNTTYYLYVRGLCEPYNSIWSNVFSFTTTCPPFEVPYFSDVENCDDGFNSSLPPCWRGSILYTGSQTGTPVQNISHPYPTSQYAMDGQRSILLPSSSYMTLPMFELPTSQLMVSFDLQKAAENSNIAGAKLIIGVSTTNNELSELSDELFTPIDTIIVDQLVNLCIQRYNIPLSSYTGSGRFITLYNPAVTQQGSTQRNNNLMIDNISVDLIPTCLAPVTIRSISEFSNSFLVSWSPSPNANGYIIEQTEIGNNTIPPHLYYTTDTFYNINQVTYSTSYNIAVRSVCDNGDTSLRSIPAQLDAYCGLIQLPYCHDFENDPISDNQPVPRCWHNSYLYHYLASTGKVSIYSSPGQLPSGHKCLRIIQPPVNTSLPFAVISLPSINSSLYPIQNTTLTFYARAEYSSNASGNTIEVGVLNNAIDSTSFVQVEAITLDETWQQYSVNFENYTGPGFRIAFRKNYTSTNHTIYIDDVELFENNPCHRPQFATTTNTTFHSADVSWYGYSPMYQFSYRKRNSSTWIDLPATAEMTIHLDSLLDTTTYEYRIRSLCSGDTLFSEWAEGSFTTNALRCVTPQNFHVVVAETTEITTDWTPVGDESGWYLRVWNTVFDTTVIVFHHPATIGGLIPSTFYNISLRPICTPVTPSENGLTQLSFTTSECEVPKYLHLVELSGSTAIVTWNSNATLFDIEYGILDFGHGSGIATYGYSGTTYQLTGLLPNTEYNVYVRAVCEGGNPSNWSSKLNFTTPNGNEITTISNTPTVIIYPNPASHTATISISGFNGEVFIDVVDIQGKTIQRSSVECTNDCSHSLLIDSLNAGYYFVRIRNSENSIVKKLIVK